MKESNKDLNRRDILKAAVAANIGLSAVAGAKGQKSRSDLIRKENEKKGTRDWQLTKTKTDPTKGKSPVASGRSHSIEGYCSANSIKAGETLKVMVNTNPVSSFKLEIFRTGYYNGDGGRLMRTFKSLKGAKQSEPSIGKNYVRECQWKPSVEFEIPKDWLSGVYLGKLTADKSGTQSYVIFIVRDDRPCDFLFQCSDLTWSAYNRWPTDYSIYTKHKGYSNIGVPSGKVSFDRPYALFTHPVNPIKNSTGSGEFLPWEFPLSFWMEQHGYDVSYISNIDTHSDAKGLLRTKGFISVGHDEYWTNQMYENVEKARDAGVNLAFLSANCVLCVVPLEESSSGAKHRVIRREGWFLPHEGNLKKQLKAKKVLNENNFNPNMGKDGAALMGVRPPVLEFGRGMGVGDWVCSKPNHWIFKGTGMKKGDSIKDLIGWEYNGAPMKSLPGLEVLAEGDVHLNKKKSGEFAATIYDGPKGNIVFSASTIWWANGLSSPPGHKNPKRHGAVQQGPDKRVQQITHNLFRRIINS